MKERWERSVVTGADGAAETILHRRGEDPLVMACRRNLQLAGSNTLIVETAEAFIEERNMLPVRKRKRDIPRDEHKAEEWDW